MSQPLHRLARGQPCELLDFLTRRERRRIAGGAHPPIEDDLRYALREICRGAGNADDLGSQSGFFLDLAERRLLPGFAAPSLALGKGPFRPIAFPVDDGDAAAFRRVPLDHSAGSLDHGRLQLVGHGSSLPRAPGKTTVPWLDLSQALSTPPVRLATSATTFAATASISWSVMVLSRGCSVTAMAIDFLPGSMPAPSYTSNTV